MRDGCPPTPREQVACVFLGSPERGASSDESVSLGFARFGEARLLCVTCVPLDVWIHPRWYQLDQSGCLLWATLSWTTQSRSAESSQASTQADSCQLPPVLAHFKAGQESEDLNTDSNSRDQIRRENLLDLKQIASPTSGLITNKLYY